MAAPAPEAHFKAYSGGCEVEVLGRRKDRRPLIDVARGDRQMIEKAKAIKEAGDAGFIFEIDNIARRSGQALDCGVDAGSLAGRDDQSRSQLARQQGDGKAGP